MKTKSPRVAELRPEYDFSGAERGRYRKRVPREGAIVVVLEPDVAEAFPDSESVNEALRVVIKAGAAVRRRPKAAGRPAKATPAPRRRNS